MTLTTILKFTQGKQVHGKPLVSLPHTVNHSPINLNLCSKIETLVLKENSNVSHLEMWSPVGLLQTEKESKLAEN